MNDATIELMHKIKTALELKELLAQRLPYGTAESRLVSELDSWLEECNRVLLRGTLRAAIDKFLLSVGPSMTAGKLYKLGMWSTGALVLKPDEGHIIAVSHVALPSVDVFRETYKYLLDHYTISKNEKNMDTFTFYLRSFGSSRNERAGIFTPKK